MTAKPSAQGTLAKTPFSHLLLYTFGRQLSGTLAIWPDSDQDKSAGQDRLLFQAGVVVAIRPMLPAENAQAAVLRVFRRRDAAYGFYEGQNLLGSSTGVLTERFDTYTLLARGVRLDPRPETMDAVLARIRGRPLRMRAGVPLDRLEFGPKERALVDTLRAAPASVDELLASTELSPHEAKRVLYLLTMVRGIEAADGQSIPPPSDATPASGTGGAASHERVASAPGDAAGAAAGRMHRSTLADPSATAPGRMPRTTLGDPGASAAGRMPRTTLGDPSATAAGRMPRATIGDSGGTGRVASQGAPTSAKPAGPLASPSQLPPPPDVPTGLSIADLTRWRELTHLYSRLDALNHFELLHVSSSTSAADISTAYFGLVKKFHPDRLPDALSPLIPCAQVVFERITEANSTLTQTESRKEYEKTVAAGGGTKASERLMRAILESALEFQKAEVLTKRRDFAQALQLITSALAKNPGEGDYHALHAWLLHLMNPGEQAPTDEMLRELDIALKSNPRSERAHYYKGIVLKRLGRFNEATRHFQQAADINPRNVDAVREVRLSAMRNDSKPPVGNSGRLLSRLFKNKGDE